MKRQHIDHNQERRTTTLWPFGSLPNRCYGSDKTSTVQATSTKRANRYLQYQAKRIHIYLTCGEFRAAILIWCLLAKNSKAYQLYLYNKVRPEWYWKDSESKAKNDLLEAMNKLRTWNLRTYINRYYIEKTNGGFRPIGAPDLASKIFMRWLSDICTITLEVYRSKLPVSNHAYRKDRGRHTAVMEILENYITCIVKHKKVPVIYEMDFKGYFNFVNWQGVDLAITRMTHWILGRVVKMYLSNIRTRFMEDLKEETELVEVGKKNGKKVLVRRGLPQGSPASPILATMACELSNPPIGLTLYADDGIYVGPDKSAIEEWLKAGEESGRYISKEKTGELNANTFKFLGYTISFGGEYIENEYGERCNLFSLKPVLMNFLKKGGTYKGREKIRWEWEVNDLAMCTNKKVNLYGWRAIATWFFGIFKLEYRGHKWIPFKGIYCVSTTSSECIAVLAEWQSWLKNHKELKPIKELKFVDLWTPKVVKAPKSVKSHYEYHPMRYSEEVKDLLPPISVREMMLMTRSTISPEPLTKVTVKEYKARYNSMN